MNILSEIKNYIIFLNKNVGLNISMHTDRFDRIIMSEELSAFNIHVNSYCSLIKSNPPACVHCVEKQKSVAKHAEKGAFAGVCFAGVREFVFPIKECNGFISVSGWKCENSKSYISKTAKKYGFSEDLLTEAYNSLKENPDINIINTLIAPLIAMLSESYRQIPPEHTPENSFAERIKEYIKLNRTRKISSEDICRKFSCSRSYMSRSFNRHTGMSVCKYITRLRISDAKFLLKNSDMNITEIAFSTGFSDANYFSSVFKKEVGTAPSEYRKKHLINKKT